MYKVTLKAARVNAGLFQSAAASALGVSKATIINWEKGKTYPNINQIEAICHLYRVPIDSIILTQRRT